MSPEKMPSSRKQSRSGFDYAGHNGTGTGHRQPPQQQYAAAGPPPPPHPSTYPGSVASYPPTYPIYATTGPGHYPRGYPGYMNGYGNGYTHAYGSEGYHHYMRNYDPSYNEFYQEGPSVEDKWRSTYPYVPTSYSYNSIDGRSTGQRRRGDGGTGGRGGRASSDLGGHRVGSEAARRPDGGDAVDGGRVNRTEEDDDEEDEIKRDNWGSKWEFIFSCVGLSVGIGNVWRFPYLAYENGGSAFLIPYAILLLLVGKPMYYMEVALGQFSQLGPVAVWKMVPIGRGIGFAMCTLCVIVAIYYNVIMSYCLYYIFASFASVLPWEECGDWSTPSCYVRTDNTSSCEADNCQSASEQYWERAVLGLHRAPKEYIIEPYNDTEGAVDVNRTYVLWDFGIIGEIKWDLSLCVLLSWIIVFACLAKGIKSSGKVVYFTATFPYVILLILLVRALFLDGAVEGLKFFFVPRWEEMLNWTVWRNAAEQMFFSLSVSWGGLITFGSYNKFKNPVHHQAMAISILDFVTSIIASIVIFSILGELSLKLNVPIKEVVQGGQGLAFVAYPEAISLLPLPQLWAVLFFFMLYTLGLDSEFALLETVLTGFYDMFPKTRRYKTWLTLGACVVCFLLSIPCFSLSGSYIVNLMDTYGGGMGVLWVAIFEMAAIMWIYGVGRFSSDLKFMLESNVSWYWKITWSVAPVILGVIFVLSVYSWKTPTYDQNVVYPDWAHFFGWFLMLFVTMQIPAVAVIMIILYAVRGKARAVVSPEADWGPGDKAYTDDYMAMRYRKAFACKQHPYGYQGYDNYGMHYPYYPGYASGAPQQPAYHM